MSSLASFRAGFIDEPGYFDYANVGPLSQRVQEEVLGELDVLRRARFGSLDYGARQAERVQNAVAALTSFAPENVVFTPNSSTALMMTLLGLSGGVMLSPTDFPSSSYAAVRSAQALGRLIPVWLVTDGGRLTPELVREQTNTGTEALVVSQVDYRTGARADLVGLREAIGPDRLLIVNAAQGFGVLDEDYAAADVVLTNGFKWVRAGYDTGFLAFTDRALERIEPVLSGFTASGPEAPLSEVPMPPRKAESFQIGPPNPVAQARFSVALESIAEVGLPVLQQAVLEAAARIMALADEFGVRVLTPREDEGRAGIVALAPGEPAAVARLSAALHNHGITATRHSDSVRLSVHVSSDDESFEMLRLALVSYARASLALS